ERRVEGRQVTNGASVGLGIRLKKPDDYFTAQFSLNYERFNLMNWSSSAFILRDGISNNLSAQITFGRFSARSDVSNIFPTTGANVSLTFKFTPPYSLVRGGKFSPGSTEVLTDADKYTWIEYHKWRFNVEWFTKLNKSIKFPLVLRFAAKFGFLGMYNERIGYSPYERFELGGDGISNIQYYGRDIISLRGFDVITPNEGAPFFDKFTLEMRFPFSLNQSATIYGLAFVEGGNYWERIRDFNPFSLKRSAGLGIRIFLPMFGMLGFDYGIRFDKQFSNESDVGASGFGNYLSKYGRFSIVLGFEPE
ncbi:MAG TPA: hypothetical protein VNJ07_12565, partial [Chitinophagales bacterium]|nr:hypothetical protein [Chitinophagales bacterium]